MNEVACYAESKLQVCNYTSEQSYKTDKKKVVESVKDEISNTWVNKLKDLVVQGDMLRVSLLEKADYIWKSFIFDMPKGVMKFMIHSFTDTLPTKNNLSRWGKRMNTTVICVLKRYTSTCFKPLPSYA